MKSIHYVKVKKGNRLTQDESIQTPIFGLEYEDDFLKIVKTGLVTAKKGYFWDGASGPTVDTRSIIRPSLWHDVGYQFIRMRVVPLKYKEYFDLLLRDLIVQDAELIGTPALWVHKIRAWYFWRGVHRFGHSSCVPGTQRKPIELTAPV